MISRLRPLLTFFILFAGAFLFLLPPALTQQSDITSGNPYQYYSDIDQALTTKLPDFQQQLEGVIKDFNKGKTPETLEWLKTTIAKGDAFIDRVRPDSNFDQLETSFDQIKNALVQAEAALQKKNYAAAKKALQRADVLTKVLLESPMLKMTQASIDLDQAGQRINNKDYIAAGMFLDHALDNLQGINIEKNPKLAAELDGIKNQIVITHQQVILGKYKADQDSRSIWKQMRQAQVESWSHYYDMWSNTYRPWDNN